MTRRGRRVPAGMARGLDLAYDDVLRMLPYSYEMVVVVPPADARDPRQWISVQHFARCRRLTNGSFLQVMPFDRPEELAPAVGGLAAVFGPECRVAVLRESNRRWAVLMGGRMPPAGRAEKPVDAGFNASAAGLECPVSQWGAVWFAPGSNAASAAVDESAVRRAER